ncbi:MAG TPA: sialidase family protein [Opitutaceae bacterium]|nr:sialidase family protein [Opitutaceae bacterium]
MAASFLADLSAFLRRVSPAVVLIGVGVVHGAPSDVPAVFAPEVAAISSPAGPGAMGASLVNGPDRRIYLSWTEPAGSGNGRALKFAEFDLAARRWSAARTIAQAPDFERSSANFPALLVQPAGRFTAVWSVMNEAPAAAPMAMAGHDHEGHAHNDDARHVLYSQSADGGATWSAPQPLTRESGSTAFPSLIALPDGKVLAAWLDGRGKQALGDNEKLYARVLGDTGPDALVDPRVCECCQTTLTGFPDGSALLAYRGRTTDEIRDIMASRYDDGKWEAPQKLSRDRWIINACPINGPQIDHDGPRVSAAWFTAAGNEPRVLLASSPDAGGLYTMPARVDLGHPLGRVDTLILRDGSQFVTWLEGPGEDSSQPAGLYLRRYASFGATLAPAPLAPSPAGSVVSGFPRMALAKDFDATPAQFVVAFTRDGDSPRVETLLVTLPAASVLAAADSSCSCSPSGEQLVGYPIRGRVTGVESSRSLLRLEHVALPGVLHAGEHEFKAAPNVLGALQAGRDVLARVEQRNGEWWIFDVRILSRPQ